jgi:hypothetical protein
MRALRSSLVLLSSLAVAAAAGCTAQVTISGGAGGVGGGGGSATGGLGGGGSAGEGGECLFCGGAGGAGGAPIEALSISPQNVLLLAANGATPTQAFTATSGANDVSAQVTWYFDRPEIGSMQGNVFTATGLVGGTGTVVAKLGMQEVSTTLTVDVEKLFNSGGLTQAQIDLLDAPNGGADPSVNIVYPYSETVFPLSVLAPELMWNGATGADVYKLEIVEKHYSYVEYFSTGVPSRHLIPELDWAHIQSSGSGVQSDPVNVRLTRLSGGVAYQPVESTWRVAQGKLKGAVYYWELPNGGGNGKILRIKADSPTAEEFFQPGGCWGCHTVSRDGKKMMANLDQPFPFPQVTIDLSQNPAQYSTINPNAGNYTTGTFGAFNDKGDRLVVSNDESGNGNKILRIIDANSAQILNGNAMGEGCGEPAWSPDGKKLAAICGLQGGGWVFDYGTGYLATADVAADGFTVSNVLQIVPQAGAPGRPAYPSFSPGSEYIAFGRPTQGSRSTGEGQLWLTKADGSDTKKLAIASSDNKSFNPVFAPLRAGGFFWTVFISRRDYGNRLVSTNRQQLWVTGIDDPPTAVDPSHPPFYLRGQDDTQLSENAYYALEPCKEVGESCESGVDCCNGTCVYDDAVDMLVCGEPPPPGECVSNGNACTVTADCCDPEATCVDGFCQLPVPN